MSAETSPEALTPQSPVSTVSATVELQPNSPEAIVRITNHSAVGLEAWRIVLVYQQASGAFTTLDLTTETLFDEATPGTPGRGPVLPGETRADRIRLAGTAVNADVELRAALFSDLQSEGDVVAILTQRDRYANALETWLTALSSVAGHAAPKAKAALAQILASEQRRTPNPDSLRVAAQMTIAELIQIDDPALFAQRTKDVTSRFSLQRRRALRHRIP